MDSNSNFDLRQTKKEALISYQRKSQRKRVLVMNVTANHLRDEGSNDYSMYNVEEVTLVLNKTTEAHLPILHNFSVSSLFWISREPLFHLFSTCSWQHVNAEPLQLLFKCYLLASLYIPELCPVADITTIKHIFLVSIKHKGSWNCEGFSVIKRIIICYRLMLILLHFV